jgi:hypothetical protein
MTPGSPNGNSLQVPNLVAISMLQSESKRQTSEGLKTQIAETKDASQEQVLVFIPCLVFHLAPGLAVRINSGHALLYLNSHHHRLVAYHA